MPATVDPEKLTVDSVNKWLVDSKLIEEVTEAPVEVELKRRDSSKIELS